MANHKHAADPVDGQEELIWRLSRIGAIGTSLAILVGLASVVFPPLRVCSETLAETGTAGVVTVCAPVFSEVALLGLLLLLLALLLLPVLSKFDVAGLLSIELKAERAQKEAEDARELAEKVQKQASELAAVQADLREVQEQLVARSVAGPAGEWTALIRDLTISEATLDQQTPSEADRGDRGALFQELMRRWDELAPYTAMGRSGYIRQGPERVVAVTEAGRSAVLDWRRRYRLEIEQVRAVRNQLAHGGRVEIEEVRRALQLADLLLNAVRDAVNKVE